MGKTQEDETFDCLPIFMAFTKGRYENEPLMAKLQKPNSANLFLSSVFGVSISAVKLT